MTKSALESSTGNVWAELDIFGTQLSLSKHEIVIVCPGNVWLLRHNQVTWHLSKPVA